MSETPQTAANDSWTVRRVLEWTTQHLKKQGSETPRLDAEILLAHSRGCPRIALYTQFDEILSESVRARMRELVQRRAQLEPVAYLVGHREFFSLDFIVTPEVLIPRPDTETLVMSALDACKLHAEPVVLDLCTGSGCVASAIAMNCPKAQVTATDLSAAALEIARQNLEKHKLSARVSLQVGDLFAAVSNTARFHVIVSNPPYIATAELETLAKDVRKYEPRTALDGGPDGLDLIRKIIREAPDYLMPGGALMLEISPEQAERVQALLAETKRYDGARLIKDLAGRGRVVTAHLKSES